MEAKAADRVLALYGAVMKKRQDSPARFLEVIKWRQQSRCGLMTRTRNIRCRSPMRWVSCAMKSCSSADAQPVVLGVAAARDCATRYQRHHGLLRDRASHRPHRLWQRVSSIFLRAEIGARIGNRVVVDRQARRRRRYGSWNVSGVLSVEHCERGGARPCRYRRRRRVMDDPSEPEHVGHQKIAFLGRRRIGHGSHRIEYASRFRRYVHTQYAECLVHAVDRIGNARRPPRPAILL